MLEKRKVCSHVSLITQTDFLAGIRSINKTNKSLVLFHISKIFSIVFHYLSKASLPGHFVFVPVCSCASYEHVQSHWSSRDHGEPLAKTLHRVPCSLFQQSSSLWLQKTITGRDQSSTLSLTAWHRSARRWPEQSLWLDTDPAAVYRVRRPKINKREVVGLTPVSLLAVRTASWSGVQPARAWRRPAESRNVAETLV